MSTVRQRRQRILAIDPISRGFGYVVLETESLRLVDWGTVECSRTKAGIGVASGALLRRYHPTLLVMECVASGRTASRRSALASSQLRVLSNIVPSCRIALVTRASISATLTQLGATTKARLVEVLCERFQELRTKAPPTRRIWEGEDARASIFDSLLLALTAQASAEANSRFKTTQVRNRRRIRREPRSTARQS